MNDKQKKQNEKTLDEHKEIKQRDYTRNVDYAEKMQSPEPWPEPPIEKNKNEK